MGNDDRLRGILGEIYGEQAGASIFERLAAVLDKYRGRLPQRARGLSQGDSILITYPDQFQEPGVPPLRSLAQFCAEHFSGVVSGVHILPFYPWTSDDGFSVVDYRTVAPEYGSWNDIDFPEGKFRLMFDAVINHASVQSEWFQGFLKGEARYRDYFIVPPVGADLSRVVRPRALPLLTPFETASGEQKVWTTFSTDQADLNYKNPDVLLEIVDVLLLYVLRGAELIRLDAIAYLWKEPGTPCIHLPQTHAIVRLFRTIFDELTPHVAIITETNVPHDENLSYFGNGRDEARLVYNFSLPPLVLHAFQTGSAERLSKWADGLRLPSKEVTFFNFLASHDGIGLNPLRGILSEEEIGQVIERVKAHGGLVSYKAEAGGGERPYELNINYFDALNDPRGDEPLKLQIDRFVAAHAILFALQGVPGIYVHSLLGSRGWPEGVEQTGRKRTINREKFRKAEIEGALAQNGSRQAEIFGRLAHLLQVRAGLRAFDPFGEQRVIFSSPEVFALERATPGGGGRVLCLQNVSTARQRVDVAGPNWAGERRDVVTGRSVLVDGWLWMEPYEVLWLV